MIYIFNNNNNLLTAKEYYIQLPIFGTDNKRAYYKLYLTLMGEGALDQLDRNWDA